jgi:hypothetical protein
MYSERGISAESLSFSRRWRAKLWRRTRAVTRVPIRARHRAGPASRLQGANADVIARLPDRERSRRLPDWKTMDRCEYRKCACRS